MPQVAETLAPQRSKWTRTRKWIVGVPVGLVVVILLAMGAFTLTLLPAKLELPQVDVGALPPAAAPAGMSLSSLPTGTYETRATFAFRGGAWSDVRQFSMTALLVRHPKGNLLIDAGAGRNVDEHVKTLPKMQRTPYTKGTPAAVQLAAHGIQLGDIAGIIPTHAHWDHISGVEDLGGVTVFESVAGKKFIDTKRQDTLLLNGFHDVHYKLYDFDGGPYLGFPRSHDVWGDGSVVIVPAPGHTPDSVIVFVTLPSGARYAAIGDTTFQLEGIELPAEKPWMLRSVIGEDNQEIHQDIALLRAASAKYQIHLLPAHDLRSFGAVPVFPASAN